MAFALAAWLTASAAHAVTFIEQAQRLERIYAALLDFRPGAPPYAAADNAHPWEGIVELIPVPPIDNQVGAKKEPVNAPPAIPRVRLHYDRAFGPFLGADATGAMAGITMSLPVPVMGYTATWLGGEGALTARWDPILVSLRAFALTGLVTGPITSGGAQDEFRFTTGGADVRVGMALGAWRAYGGYGVGRLETMLTVVEDGSRIRDDGSYAYLLAGGAYQWNEHLLITLEQESTENYLRHVILGASWRF